MEHPASTSVAAPTAWDVIDASRRLSRHLETRLDDALEELAISYAQFEILKLLTRDRNAHAAALARRLRVSRQIASRSPNSIAVDSSSCFRPTAASVCRS
jgi:hypothetical protein